jgi:hypothetical protein
VLLSNLGESGAAERMVEPTARSGVSMFSSTMLGFVLT